MKDVDAVILCGGEGRRLQAAVSDRPKPMAPVNGVPFIDILIKHASSYGAGRFILCAGYKAQYIREYYSHRPCGEVILSVEDTPLDTGGAVKRAQGCIRTSPFLVMNGDSYCPVDLDGFLDFHRSKKALASMVVVSGCGSTEGGSVLLDASGRVKRFSEKDGRAGGTLVNGGIYLFEKKVLAMIPAGRAVSLEREFFPRLAGSDFYGYLVSEELLDIGTPQRYKHACRVLR